MQKFFFFLIIFIAILVIIIRQIESRSIFFPTKGIPEDSGQAITHENVFFETDDGKKLHGWFVPAASGDAASVVLFLHGNAGNIGHRWEKIHLLHDLGMAVFIFDYRGFGQSEGRPSEQGIYKDTDAAYVYLNDRGLTPEHIVVYGESIGGAFAADLASKKKVKALILEEAFTSVPAMTRKILPFIPTIALATRLDTLSKIPNIRAPKLIFHSVEDEIVPFEMGKALFDAAAEPKKLIQLHGGHNTAFLEDSERYKNSLAAFFSELQKV